jgi:hypothetical protein
MPLYSYECRACGNIWRDNKPMAARLAVMCTICQSQPQELMPDPDDNTRMVSKVYMLMPQNVTFISDITHQDGAGGEPIHQPGLGKDVYVSSRRQLKEEREKVREKLFNDTDGEHRTLRPFRDPGSGKIIHDFVTHHNTGHDIGEIVTMEEGMDGNNVMSAFDEGKTLAETEAELAADIGAPIEDPKPAKVRKKGK